MYKRVKKVNLNTSDKAHGKLMLKNLLTSLLLSGKLVTTSKRAKTLKQYAERIINQYNKIKTREPIYRKTWLQNNIAGHGKSYKEAVENLKRIAQGVKLRLRKVGFRSGDGALLYEVSILNFEEKKDE